MEDGCVERLRIDPEIANDEVEQQAQRLDVPQEALWRRTVARDRTDEGGALDPGRDCLTKGRRTACLSSADGQSPRPRQGARVPGARGGPVEYWIKEPAHRRQRCFEIPLR